MSQYSFNAREVEPDAGIGDPIPDGWYNLVILKAPEFGPNSAQTGTKIDAQFTVADGPYKGRVIFHNFNVENPNEKSMKIGKAQLSALSYAVNVMQWTATEQLMNIVFLGKVGVEPAANGYPAKNKMTAFKHINDPSAGKPVMVAPQATRPLTPPPQAAMPPAQSAPPTWTPPPTTSAPPTWTPPPPMQAQPAAPAPQAPPTWTPPAAPQAWEQPQQAPQPVAAPPTWQPPPPQAAPAYAPPPQAAPPAYAPPPQQAPAAPPAYAPPQAPVGEAPPWAQPAAPQQ